MMKFTNFCGIFATVFITTTIILLASCSQDDDYYENSEMYTLAEMGTRLGGDLEPGEENYKKCNDSKTDQIFTIEGLTISCNIEITYMADESSNFLPQLSSVRITSGDNGDYVLIPTIKDLALNDETYSFTLTITPQRKNDPETKGDSLVYRQQSLPKSCFQ